MVREQAFKLKEEVVVIQQAMRPLILRVLLKHLPEGVRMGQEVLRLAAQKLLHGQFLVARLAEQPQHGRGVREAPVSLARSCLFAAGLERRRAVRRIHDAQGPRGPVGGVAAQHGIGIAVEGAPAHVESPELGKIRGAQEGCSPLLHLLRSLAREGEEQHGPGLLFPLGQPRKSVHDGAGLARTGPGNDQKRPPFGSDRLALGFVEGADVKHRRLRQSLQTDRSPRLV